MGRALKLVLKWTVLTAVAVSLGSAIGAAYALNLQEPEEALAPHPLPEPGGGRAAAADPQQARDLAAPPAPALLAPRDGAYVSWSPTLSWEAVADASNVIYAIDLSTDPGFPPETTETIRNVEGTAWRPDEPFSPLVEVHWRVRALDAALNEGPWSDAWSFLPVVPAGDVEVDADVGSAQ